MSIKNIEHLIQRLEGYLECWKQFNHFVGLARSKEFTPEDEEQFLEIKSVIAQELELILAYIDSGPVTREEVHNLLASGPSIRFLSEMNEAALRNVENQWHKIFIGLQSVLGQLKVRQRLTETKGVKSWFGSKAA